MGELISRAGLTKSYYQSRAGLQMPFNTNDIEALAAVLDVTPAALANPDPASSRELRIPVSVISSRVRRLLSSRAATEGVLLDHLGQIDPGFAESGKALLASEASTMVVSEGMLMAIAQWVEVDPEYLTDPDDADVADRVDAVLELREVMSEVGASTIQFRALGQMDPAALRAIAASLRARAGTPSA